MTNNPPQISEEAKNIFHEALLALHKDVAELSLKRGSKNPFFNSKYIKLNDMIGAIRPLCHQHGFILSQPVDLTAGQSGITNVLFTSLVHAKTGISEVSKIAIKDDYVEEVKKGKDGVISHTEKTMQKLGAAITYARRQGLSSLFGLQEEDDDGNFVSGKVVGDVVSGGKDNF